MSITTQISFNCANWLRSPGSACALARERLSCYYEANQLEVW